MESQNYLASAEAAFKRNNFQQALDYATMAKNSNPTLHGIDNIMAAYKIHVIANNKSHRQTDWYGVLNVREMITADVETIKRCYKKLALMVHPDKNKSVAAEGAFKLVNEAWEILSNTSKREAHDSFVQKKSSSFRQRQRRRGGECRSKSSFRRRRRAEDYDNWWRPIMRSCYAPSNGCGFGFSTKYFGYSRR